MYFGSCSDHQCSWKDINKINWCMSSGTVKTGNSFTLINYQGDFEVFASPPQTRHVVLKPMWVKFATSGRHNSAMITNAENSWPNGLPTGCLVSIFTVRITSTSFAWTVRCIPDLSGTHIFRTSVVRYYPIVRCSAGVAQSHRYGSGAA